MRERILEMIEKNSRIDLKDLAVMLGTNEVTVMNELEAMEKEHIICGYHTMINWDKTSLDRVNAIIEVKVTPQRDGGFAPIAGRIYNYPEVNAVYLVSGAYDLLVLIDGKSLKDISFFVSSKLSTIENVLSTATYFILKKYKDHGIIFSQKTEDERIFMMP